VTLRNVTNLGIQKVIPQVGRRGYHVFFVSCYDKNDVYDLHQKRKKHNRFGHKHHLLPCPTWTKEGSWRTRNAPHQSFLNTNIQHRTIIILLHELNICIEEWLEKNLTLICFSPCEVTTEAIRARKEVKGATLGACEATSEA